MNPVRCVMSKMSWYGLVTEGYHSPTAPKHMTIPNHERFTKLALSYLALQPTSYCVRPIHATYYQTIPNPRTPYHIHNSHHHQVITQKGLNFEYATGNHAVKSQMPANIFSKSIKHF